MTLGDSPHPVPKRAQYLLIAGAALGFVLAASGLTEFRRPGDPTAVATVNGYSIGKEQYLAYLSLLGGDKREPLTAEDRRHVLNRMIEEKLLVDRAIDMGLPHSDPTIRKLIATAVIEIAAADAAASEPDEATLRAFYVDNMAYFSRPDQVRVRRILFQGRDAGQRAEQAHQALLEGQAFADVNLRFGDREILPLPDALLPPNKLHQYLGARLTRAAMALSSGQFSGPIAEGDANAAYSLIYVVEKEQASPKEFEEVAQQVAAEYRRRRGDQVVRDFLEDLRRRADTVVDEAFLDSLDQAPGNSG